MSGLSATAALQKAIFTALAGDGGLIALLGGVRIYDGAPRDAPAPYVHIAEAQERDWSTSTEAGAEVTVALVVWSREPGRSEVLSIAQRLRARLHDAALTVEGWRLVNLRHLATETSRDETLQGRRAELRLRAVLEEL